MPDLFETAILTDMSSSQFLTSLKAPPIDPTIRKAVGLAKTPLEDILDADGRTVPWLPLQDEPPLDYQLFRNWLDVGPSRPKLKKADKRAELWCWSDRARLYDDWHADNPAEIVATPSQMLQKAKATVAITFGMIQNELAKHAALSASTTQPVTTLESLVNIAEKIIKLERLINGQSTENVEVSHKYDQLTDEELAVLDELEKKASVSG